MSSAYEENQGSRRATAGLGDLLERFRADTQPVKEQIDRNARALAQSALSRLDVVSRAEFDAQTAVLQRTRERVEALEKELERLTQQLEDSSAD